MKPAYRSKTNGSGAHVTTANGPRRTPSRKGSPENAPAARMADLLVRLCGRAVVATVSLGAKYLGVLQAVDGGRALSVVLAHPQIVQRALLNEKSNCDDAMPELLVIQAKDLIEVDVVVDEKDEKREKNDNEEKDEEIEEKVKSDDNVKVEEKVPTEEKEKSEEKVTSEEKAAERQKVRDNGIATVGGEETGENGEKSKGPKLADILKEPPRRAFKTDVDIASGFQARERELQRWVPDSSTAEVSLEDTGGAWDQFQVNRDKFGVESTYDEHLYTTRIDTSAADYAERLKHAERVAREIEGLASNDRHVKEERGHVDDSGWDDEDKYSGVVNDAPVPDTRGVELMAALRNASLLAEPAALDAGKDAAQYHNDPAIVSSLATQQKLPTTGDENKPASVPSKPAGESFRLNAKSEINALKEFSVNFKIPHRLPNDLLPILAKDKGKQDEILRKLEPRKPASPDKNTKLFKLNPKAATFTPAKTLDSPVPPRASFSKSPSNPSPRMHAQRPYSAGSTKRHHQITAADFFGGADKVPTAVSQREKILRFQNGFNLFMTALNHADGKPIVFQKAFHTPPTWDSTVDETYEELWAQRVQTTNKAPVPAAMPYMPAPYMPQMGGFPGQGMPFQQQFQAPVFYQLFQGAPPAQPQMMYEGQFVPPGFIPGGFVSPGSPVGGSMAMGSPYMSNHQGNYNHTHNRRYNGHLQKPRGSHA